MPVVPALALCTLLIVARFRLLGAGQLDYDEGVYWQSLRALAAGHPLYTSVFSSQPPGFLLGVEPVWAALGGSIAAARSVMLAWGLVSIGSGAVIGWRLMGVRGAVIMAALLASDPLMVRQSVVLQAEGPAVALGLLAIALAEVVVSMERIALADLAAVASGAALALGVLNKLLDVAVVPALVAPLWLNPPHARRLLGVTTGALLASAVVLLPLSGAWAVMLDQAVGLHIASQSLPLGGLTDPAFAAALVREAPLLGIAAAGAVLGRRRHPRPVVVGLAWVAGAVVAMLLTHPLWPRHLVSVVPAAALLGTVGLVSIVERMKVRMARPAAAVGLACLFGLGVAGITTLGPGATFVPLVTELDRAASPRAVIVTDDQFVAAVAGWNVPPELVDTSFVRVETGGITTSGIAAVLKRDGVCAVVFSTGRLRQVPGLEQWLNANYSEVIDLGDGSLIYMRPGC